jgi:hypothetical protein
MPRTSASPLASGLAVVFDFLPALARHHLATRVGLRGSIRIFTSGEGKLTLVHQHRVSCGAELVEDRIAQLRPVAGGYQLFWKKGNGRWTAYCGRDCDPFVGSLDVCFTEIARDPFGCYWS